MRDNYNEDKNPLIQVREYITELQSKRARTRDGRDIPIDNNTPFYCYIVCDIRPTLDNKRRTLSFWRHQTGQGFFGFKRHYNAYFEMILVTPRWRRTRRSATPFCSTSWPCPHVLI